MVGEASDKQLRPGGVLLLEVLKGEKLVKLVITQYINRDKTCSGAKFSSDWLYLETYGLRGSTITFRLGDTELGQNHLELLGENQSFGKGSLLMSKEKFVSSQLAYRLTYGSMLTCYFIFIPYPALVL